MLPDNSVKRVGRNGYRYTQVKYDDDGFADSSIYLPEDFDMCYLLLDDGKIKKGWWGGFAWDGAVVNKDDTITHWRRQNNL